MGMGFEGKGGEGLTRNERARMESTMVKNFIMVTVWIGLSRSWVLEVMESL